jgi:hypothetical protein
VLKLTFSTVRTTYLDSFNARVREGRTSSWVTSIFSKFSTSDRFSKPAGDATGLVARGTCINACDSRHSCSLFWRTDSIHDFSGSSMIWWKLLETTGVSSFSRNFLPVLRLLPRECFDSAGFMGNLGVLVPPKQPITPLFGGPSWLIDSRRSCT